VLATAPARGRGAVHVEVVSTFAEILDRGLAMVGVDMPIGLPDAGPRACDREARRLIGPRRSSIFPVPPRAVLGASSYAEALARCRTVDGRGLSTQAFNLIARIAEVDALVSPEDATVVEVSPEASFATMAGAPLPHAKRTAEGRTARVALLAGHLPGATEVVEPRPRGARPDDVLDALAVAWTARRVVAGTAGQLGDGARDGQGRTMSIWV